MLLRCILMLCLPAAMAAGQSAAPDVPVNPEWEALPRIQLSHADDPVPINEEPDSRERRWHVFVAVVNTYPRLASEKPIDDILEPAVRLIAPGFDGYRTVGDLRDKGLIWAPHAGIGFRLSDYLGIFVQGGYSGGKVHTAWTGRSRALLPFHTSLEIKRAAAYFGLGLDYFPWKQPEAKTYANWGERLKAARPFLGIRYTWTHATYEAKVRLQLRPLPRLGIDLDDAWFVPSVNLNVGLEIPVDERGALFVNGGYAFFGWQRHDFEGPTFTAGWKYLL